MVNGGTTDDYGMSLAKTPATAQHRKFVLVVAAILLAAFGITAPFVTVQLPHFVSFNPSVESIVFVNDLVTSILLFSQYVIDRSRAILALATGYLYSALIVVPHILVFPGAFDGLLPAGPQSSPWLYYFWSAGIPVAVIVYSLLADTDRVKRTAERSAFSIIATSAVLVIFLVSGITWLTTVDNGLLPALTSDNQYSSTTVYVANPLAILIAAIAFALLWSRKRSVLDYWLLLAMFSLALNYVIAAFLAQQRYSLGFYVSRVFTVATSMIVLALLLTAMTKLYMRLAHANTALARERDNKLMNFEAVTAAISHEIRQPLASISASGQTAQILLERAPLDYHQIQETLNDIVDGSQRASEALDGIRALFRKTGQARQLVDLNWIIRDVLQSLQTRMNDSGITARAELTRHLPLVEGNGNQLHEVIANLVQNGIDATGTTANGHRLIKVKTGLRNDSEIVVEIEDSGPGIGKEDIKNIFDPFVTTKDQGTGLGLAICRMIVDYHAGQLSAASDGRNGALFRLVLPIKGRDENAARPE